MNGTLPDGMEDIKAIIEKLSDEDCDKLLRAIVDYAHSCVMAYIEGSYGGRG